MDVIIVYTENESHAWIPEGYRMYPSYDLVSSLAIYASSEIYAEQDDGTWLVLRSKYRLNEVISAEEGLLMVLKSKPVQKRNNIFRSAQNWR